MNPVLDLCFSVTNRMRKRISDLEKVVSNKQAKIDQLEAALKDERKKRDEAVNHGLKVASKLKKVRLKLKDMIDYRRKRNASYDMGYGRGKTDVNTTRAND